MLSSAESRPQEPENNQVLSTLDFEIPSISLVGTSRIPSELTVNTFLTELAVEQNVAASTQNQALAALLVFHENVLGKPLDRIEGVVRARKPKRLPVVLSKTEVQAILSLIDGVPKLVCMVLYGSGPRLTEALSIRVKDIDFDRGELMIRDGKGQKDRVTMLPIVVRDPIPFSNTSEPCALCTKLTLQ